MGSPETIISSARSTPATRGSRWVPPAPGRMPSFTSGRPSLASGAATRWVQVRASSSPPPKATPWIAATTGFLQPSRISSTSCSDGDMGGLVNSVMSAPPEKPRPAPISTMALTPGSASAAFTPSATAVRTAIDRAFTGGESSVTIAT